MAAILGASLFLYLMFKPPKAEQMHFLSKVPDTQQPVWAFLHMRTLRTLQYLLLIIYVLDKGERSAPASQV
jgi:hypothetical protein